MACLDTSIAAQFEENKAAAVDGVTGRLGFQPSRARYGAI
jgi:hypothetical protein